MHRSEFNKLKAGICNASAAQILEVEGFISHVIAQQFVEIALARRTKTVTEKRICPHCFGHDVLRHGKDQNNRQRFRCRGCNRTYNILTGTPMARARKPEKWGAYLNFMTQHSSVRAIRMSGIGLNHVTIWRWRHRFLKAAANDNAAVLCGVIEVATTSFRHSVKGSRKCNRTRQPNICFDRMAKNLRSSHQVPVLTALDSTDAVAQGVLTSLSDIEMLLTRRIAAGSVLCSEGQAVFARVADTAQAEPWPVVAVTATDAMRENPVVLPGPTQGRLSLGRVHAHHQRLRHLVNESCCGVATRYLCNYLGWHRAMVRPSFEGKSLLARALA